MAITVADIKLLASARMDDTADGGGQMTGVPLQDGAENNVFFDISSTDRAFGRLSLRKVNPAVLNAGTDTLLGAHIILDDMPDDANVDAFAFAGAGATESRSGAVSRVQGSGWTSGAGAAYAWAVVAPRSFQRIKAGSSAPTPWAGMVLLTVDNGPGAAFSGTPHYCLLLTVTEVLSTDPTFAEGFASTVAGDRVFEVTWSGLGAPSFYVGASFSVAPARYNRYPGVVSTKAVQGALTLGATHCDVSSLLVALVPMQVGGAAGAANQIGISATGMVADGRAAAFNAGGGLVVHHTGEVAAAAYANGNTVNVGRTNIASFRLVGANGVSIPSGWTGNLTTGVVTINDVTGWSQPVRVRHTIEEVLSCARTSYPTGNLPALSVPNRITFNRALTRDFPTGTLISSMLLLGDLAARVGQSFSQESWTGDWSNSRIGGAVAAQYQQAGNPIAVTNAGALNEQWALIFTTSTTFRVVGESLGQIATGDINSTLAPINPATGVPYFSIAVAGWGAGWASGNVLRFNTTGANAPVWVGRVVLPSAPNATPDSLTVAVRGDIDA